MIHTNSRHRMLIDKIVWTAMIFLIVPYKKEAQSSFTLSHNNIQIVPLCVALEMTLRTYNIIWHFTFKTLPSPVNWFCPFYRKSLSNWMYRKEVWTGGINRLEFIHSTVDIEVGIWYIRRNVITLSSLYF